jgi:hypothetical protein
MGNDYNLTRKFQKAFNLMNKDTSNLWIGCLPVTKHKNESQNGSSFDFALIRRKKSNPSSYCLVTLDFTVSRTGKNLKEKIKKYALLLDKIIVQNE